MDITVSGLHENTAVIPISDRSELEFAENGKLY